MDDIAKQAQLDGEHDVVSTIFDGVSPNALVCDATLREMDDGSWVMVMLGGGDSEPLPENRIFLTRSMDRGKSWSPMAALDLGVKEKNPEIALVPSELMVYSGRCTMFVTTHDGKFEDWKEWLTHSNDSGRTWSPLEPAPGKLKDRTFIRNHIVTRDGRIMLPFQHYVKSDAHPSGRASRNGVMISDDGGKNWSLHGDICLTRDRLFVNWNENSIVELSDGTIAMIIRADGMGVLYYVESKDGGRTWPDFAQKSDVPNPGCKAALYGLGGDAVAMLHNPNPKHRSPMALWVSFDGMKTWPYRRVLVGESCDGPDGKLAYPDGFVSEDKQFLHFAFDDNRHRAVYVKAKLPKTEQRDMLV